MDSLRIYPLEKERTTVPVPVEKTWNGPVVRVLESGQWTSAPKTPSLPTTNVPAGGTVDRDFFKFNRNRRFHDEIP